MSFQLTNPSEVNVCPSCDQVARSMSRHRGSAVCQKATYARAVARLGVEQFWDRPTVFRAAGLPCVKLRASAGKGGLGYHSAAWAVAANIELVKANVPEHRRIELLRGGEGNAELERERVIIALAAARPLWSAL